LKTALALAAAIGYALWKVIARLSPEPEFDAKNVYLPFAKKLLDAMQPAGGAQRVVLDEFPHPGVRTVGFVTRMLRDSRIAAREAAAMPFPSEETTPPVTKTYLVIDLARVIG